MKKNQIPTEEVVLGLIRIYKDRFLTGYDRAHLLRAIELLHENKSESKSKTRE